MKYSARVECILEVVRTMAPTWGIDQQALARVEARPQVSRAGRTQFTPAFPPPARAAVARHPCARGGSADMKSRLTCEQHTGLA